MICIFMIPFFLMKKVMKKYAPQSIQLFYILNFRLFSNFINHAHAVDPLPMQQNTHCGYEIDAVEQ